MEDKFINAPAPTTTILYLSLSAAAAAVLARLTLVAKDRTTLLVFAANMVVCLSFTSHWRVMQCPTQQVVFRKRREE